jgi:hypothetical protein
MLASARDLKAGLKDRGASDTSKLRTERRMHVN